MTGLHVDVAVIGGGVMGLLSAYRLRQQGFSVAIIDSGTIGGPQAASSGISRSIRNDYQDPLMARMAHDAFREWQALEKAWNTQLIDACGFLNIYNAELTDVTLEASYAVQSAAWLERDKRRYEVFGDSRVTDRYSQLAVDYAVLDVDAGVALPRQVTAKLLEFLRADSGVQLIEKTLLLSISPGPETVSVRLHDQQIRAKKLVVTAGLGTSDICQNIVGLDVSMPIRPDRPFELKYFFTDEERYKSSRLPGVAFLDVGIYAHPVIDGFTNGVKIGYYSPPGIELTVDDSLQFIDRFVGVCLPELCGCKNEVITEVDQCSYDMTSDGKFILGYLGDNKNIIVAAGFNGTGYKFAPVISAIVDELVREKVPAYDITAFRPNRYLNQRGVGR